MPPAPPIAAESARAQQASFAAWDWPLSARNGATTQSPSAGDNDNLPPRKTLRRRLVKFLQGAPFAPHSAPSRLVKHPEPLWYTPMPGTPTPRRSELAGAGHTPLTRAPNPAIFDVRPCLTPDRPLMHASPAIGWSLSLHPKVAAARHLLTQPTIVESFTKDVQQALDLLGPGPFAQQPAGSYAARIRRLHLSAAQLEACLWRGLAKARLGDASAKTELLVVLRATPFCRAALVHLLPLLIQAPGMRPSDAAHATAEGYMALAVADYPEDPYVRLSVALLAYYLGEVARCRRMLVALTESHPAYGPSFVVLAALEAEAYATTLAPERRKSALDFCSQNIALFGHQDMALCVRSAIWSFETQRPDPSVAQLKACYGDLLFWPEDVFALPLVVLDPQLAPSDANTTGAAQGLPRRTASVAIHPKRQC